MTRQRGFTLIELLVVIAIIGILATLVITQLTVARVKARNSTAQNDISEGGKAIETFRADDVAANRVVDSGKATVGGVNNTLFTAPAATMQAAVVNGDTTHADINYTFNGVFNVASGTYSLDLNKTPNNTYTYTYISCLKFTGTYPGSIGTSGSQANTTNSTGYIFYSNLDQTNGSGAAVDFWATNSSAGGGGTYSGALPGVPCNY